MSQSKLPESPNHLDNDDINIIESFRKRKLKQVTIACQICLTFLIIYMFFINKFDTVLVLLANMMVIGASYFVAKYKSILVGSSFFLLFISSCCCLLLWLNEGLTDEALTLIPGIIIFSSVIANFRLTLVLLIIFSINILLLGYFNQTDIYISTVNQSNIEVALVLIAILVLTTFSVSLMSRDLNRILKQLELENKNVKDSKKEILRLQNHDPLTGLPNRVLSQQVFEQRVQLGLRERFNTSLMFIDIDNFKTINDTLGHNAGDEFLIEIANRLSASVRMSDAVFRLGGDEFVVIAHHHSDEVLGSALAEKILAVLQEPIMVKEMQVSLSASIGIAIAPQDGVNFYELNKKADMAMYRAKAAGRNCYHFFHPDMSVDNTRHLQVAQSLKSALSTEQFQLHYQPIQSLESKVMLGAEVLLRWHHPELGEIPPAEFIPIAEKSGAIADIGIWVLDKAIAQCKHWHDKGLNIYVSVNVSAAQFRRENFASRVQEILDMYEFSGEYLILEITESMLFEISEELEQRLNKIADSGVKFAIDDFGTGYSNLGYLQKLDAYSLKIDRSFVSHVHRSKEDLAIVEAIVSIAKRLNIKLVAEGIESEKQANTLIDLGVEMGQGYLYAKPLSADALWKLANSQA